MKKLILFLFFTACSQLKNESEYSNREEKNEIISNNSNNINIKLNSTNPEIDNNKVKEFSEIDFSHFLSKNYIESLLKDGDSVKILDTKYKEQSNSKIRVTTEYKVIRNSKKKTIRMRLIADFDREKNIMIQVVFHNQI